MPNQTLLVALSFVTHLISVDVAVVLVAIRSKIIGAVVSVDGGVVVPVPPRLQLGINRSLSLFPGLGFFLNHPGAIMCPGVLNRQTTLSLRSLSSTSSSSSFSNFREILLSYFRNFSWVFGPTRPTWSKNP